MKICIVGGHLTPALGVLDALGDTHQVIFIGRKYTFEKGATESLEYKLVTSRGIPFFALITGRLQRTISFHMILSLLKIPIGFFHALSILYTQKPSVVLSFGGYLSVPVGFAARILGIPVIIHEQTLEAGLANKVLAKIATAVCVSWENSQQFFPKEKVVVTGNPVGVRSIEKHDFDVPDEKLPLLYVTGGSAGAHAINILIGECLEALVASYRIIHQTGDAKEYNDFERLSKKREQLGQKEQRRYIITKFVEPAQVASIMKQASIVISRAGMNTVTELLLLEKPSILIPLPHGQRNEQKANAEYLRKSGLAEVLPQSEATPEALLTLLKNMLAHLYHYKTNHEKIVVGKEAAEKITQVLEDVSSKNKGH